MALTDRVIIAVFREPETSDTPAPPAPAAWARALILESAERLGSDKIFLAVAASDTYWPADDGPPETISHASAMQLAGASPGTAVEFVPERDGTTVVLPAGGLIWLLDAASVWNTLPIQQEAGVRDVLLWQVGTEDPWVWPLMLSSPGPVAAHEIETLRYRNGLTE